MTELQVATDSVSLIMMAARGPAAASGGSGPGPGPGPAAASGSLAGWARALPWQAAAAARPGGGRAGPGPAAASGRTCLRPEQGRGADLT
jgi:hypothetical protein